MSRTNYDTLGNCLIAVAEQYPDQPAIISDTVTLTWADVVAKTDEIAKGFLAMGVGRGSHVAMLTTNSVTNVLMLHALMRIGAVAVLLNWNATELEIAYALSLTDSVMLVSDYGRRDGEFIRICDVLSGRDPAAKKPELPKLKHILYAGEPEVSGYMHLREMLAKASLISDEQFQHCCSSVEGTDIAAILFTSGTTSKPKAVMLTHRALIRNSQEGVRGLRITQKDRYCVSIPLFHCFCLVTNLFSAFFSGGTVVLCKDQACETILSCIARHKCTILHSVPTIFLRMAQLKNLSDYDISSLRTGIIGGNVYSPAQYMEIRKKLGMETLMSSLGMTEATATVTLADYDDDPETLSHTVGSFIPGTEGKIVCCKTGESLPAGQVGEICIRGYNVMAGYYNQPELTAESIDSDGWLHTGDLGSLDENGQLYFKGRKKEIIIRGGENISPLEIEDCLSKHPLVQQVKVIGIPDAQYGEKVCACLILRECPAQSEQVLSAAFRQHCIQNLARVKVPAYFLVFDHFPVTASGKVRAKDLRQLSIERLQIWYGLELWKAYQTQA